MLEFAHDRGKKEVDKARTLRVFGASVALFSPLVGHNLYKIEDALGNLNALKWHANWDVRSQELMSRFFFSKGKYMIGLFRVTQRNWGKISVVLDQRKKWQDDKFIAYEPLIKLNKVMNRTEQKIKLPPPPECDVDIPLLQESRLQIEIVHPAQGPFRNHLWQQCQELQNIPSVCQIHEANSRFGIITWEE